MYKFFIETFGCQMNQLDSEIATSGLINAGLERAAELAAADVIIFNTCSIRQHAEDKVYSALGRLKQWKLQKPAGIIGVIGCMAQKDQNKIIARAPHVDIVLGPGQLDLLAQTVHRLLNEKNNGLTTKPEILISLTLEKNKHNNKHSATVENFKLFDPERNTESRKNRFQALVRIMLGCNKFCTYCIVPTVRGREQSRPPQQILSEVQQLVEQGVKEITFIGQTVNAYKFPKTHQPQGVADDAFRLSDLLYMSSAVNGLERIKFVTNYPTGMGDDLLTAVKDLPKVAKYLHIPAQSGSDNILKRMKRQYTVSAYRELIDKIRQTIPSAAITSDFIVGFCGETEEEFAETVELVKYCRFKNSFIFKYSERPGTKASELYKDDIPDEIKKRRNNELLAIQDEISLELNKQFIGQKVEILVEEISKNYNNEKIQLSGRTNCDRIVVFDSNNKNLLGQFLEIKIQNTTPFTLFGQL
ncbi:MAG: tRNA (N6-isopentenyl adenosine(37)-C2)-methylthiotransferase MiaB [Planctomycetaceae bacterium]|nr:tRNA (N6-isopentenyl adenosine(37)-C2)-methylthiotransferase MiaB [Planctomycetaceae bacterium]